MLLADSDLGSLLKAEIRVSLSLFVTMTSFMQTVGFAIMPSMKQHLVKNYFWTANYNILSKKHSVFIFSGLFFKVSHQLNLILYSLALVVILSSTILLQFLKKILGFCFPCSDDVHVAMMMLGTFSPLYTIPLLYVDSEKLSWRHVLLSPG